MDKPGFIYLARATGRGGLYRFAQTADCAILKSKKDAEGRHVVHAWPVADMWGIHAFLFGFFHEKYVEFQQFALDRCDVADIKALDGQIVDQVALQLLGVPEATTEI